MFIFIRHGEKARDNINLSDVGFVRRNNLKGFFDYINKKHLTKNVDECVIRLPERIITSKQENNESSDKPYQTVRVLANQLNINIESYKAGDIVKSLKNKDLDIDTLICLDHEKLVSEVEKLIYKIYNIKLGLHWGINPQNTYHDNLDYTSVWILNTESNELVVYSQFDVIYNPRYDYYNIDYLKIKDEPIFKLKLEKSTSMLGSLINNVINTIWW
jgi:hypothetical protein